MARIKAFEKPGFIKRFTYGQAAKALGKVPEPMTIMAHHSKLFTADAVFEIAMMKSRLMDDRLKALAGLKAATRVGCPF